MKIRDLTIAAALCGSVLMGNSCSAGTSDEVRGCVHLIPPADYQDDVDRQVLENLSYTGGVWYTSDGTIFGYSKEEDSTVWNKDGCD
jgi:hypothetical protein